MRRFAILLFLSLCAPALAQNESVTVTAQNLIGPWRILRPTWAHIGIGGQVSHGPLRDSYCRIEEIRKELRVFCLERSDAGNVDLDGTHIRLSWGSMLARMFIDGTLQSSERFSARTGLALSGVTIAAIDNLNGRKVDQSVPIADDGKLGEVLKTLLNDMANGTPDARVQGAPVNITLPKAESLKPLGALQAVNYLGRTPTQAERWQTDGESPDDIDFLHVYVVEFEKGERLCRIHQTDSGIIDGFRCV